MHSVEPASGTPARGITRTRCETCKRFARLLPGDTECSACSGTLGLEFGDITGANTVLRGGW